MEEYLDSIAIILTPLDFFEDPEAGNLFVANSIEQLRNQIEAAVYQISPHQCLVAIRAVCGCMLAFLQEANILNNIYIINLSK